MDELKPKQQQAIAAILSSGSITEAANQAGLNERTIYRWMTQDDFRAALYSEEDRVIDIAIRRLLNLSDKAINTFEELLGKEAANDNVKLRAAQLVIDNLIRLRELQTIDARLSELEEKVRAK